jgi:hypothetical protein
MIKITIRLHSLYIPQVVGERGRGGGIPPKITCPLGVHNEYNAALLATLNKQKLVDKLNNRF